MLKVLALDCATRTGYAVDGPDGRPAFGTFTLLGAGPELGARFCMFETAVRSLIVQYRPEVVAFEQPLLRADRAARLLIGLASVAELVATSYRLRCLEADPATIKKHLTGAGNADKAAMVKTCRLLGWDVTDDNAADALALWDYARHYLRQPGTVAGPLFPARAVGA